MLMPDSLKVHENGMLPTMGAHATASPDVPRLAPIHSSGLSFRENFSDSLHSSSTRANSTNAA